MFSPHPARGLHKQFPCVVFPWISWWVHPWISWWVHPSSSICWRQSLGGKFSLSFPLWQHQKHLFSLCASLFFWSLEDFIFFFLSSLLQPGYSLGLSWSQSDGSSLISTGNQAKSLLLTCTWKLPVWQSARACLTKADLPILPPEITFPWSLKVNCQVIDLTANKVLAGDLRGGQVSGNDTSWLLLTLIC